jgi:hypothetical protein
MPQAVHYVPILTTLLAIPFTVVLYRHWRRKPSALYLAWWMFGVADIGGTFTRMGHVEVLYVTEIVGLLFIWGGYHAIVSDRKPSLHANQQPYRAAP